MEHILNVLTSNKILLAAAVFASILIVLSAFKKLVMAALVLLALLVLYVGYLTYTGQKVPKTKQEVMEYGTKKIDTIKKEGHDTMKQVNKK
jgi:F0F1-type ATP synthase membrane subunit a